MKKILTLIFFAALIANATTVKSGPLELGPGNRAMMAQAYTAHYHDRASRVPLNLVRAVYAQERARQVCTNWKVSPQSEFETCMWALTTEFVK